MTKQDMVSTETIMLVLQFEKWVDDMSSSLSFIKGNDIKDAVFEYLFLKGYGKETIAEIKKDAIHIS